jgi:PEP-CTERM motif
MKRLLLLALSTVALAQPAGVSAQLFYNGIPGAQEYLDFLGGSNVGFGGVQVGPYVAQFTSDIGQDFSIYCVDYNHHAIDQLVNVSALASTGLSNTRLGALGDAAAFDTYRTAAYLASLFDTAPATGAAWGPIHRAIWALTSGQSQWDSYLSDTYLGAGWETAAANFNTDGWYVLSPTDQPGGQEFLMRTVSVPEPATFVLLATGLLLLAAFSRRRLQSSTEAA